MCSTWALKRLPYHNLGDFVCAKGPRANVIWTLGFLEGGNVITWFEPSHHGRNSSDLFVRTKQRSQKGLKSSRSLRWVAVKIMFPVWVLSIIRHLVFRGPRGDHDFDNHPDRILRSTMPVVASVRPDPFQLPSCDPSFQDPQRPWHIEVRGVRSHLYLSHSLCMTYRHICRNNAFI